MVEFLGCWILLLCRLITYSNSTFCCRSKSSWARICEAHMRWGNSFLSPSSFLNAFVTFSPSKIPSFGSVFATSNLQNIISLTVVGLFDPYYREQIVYDQLEKSIYLILESSHTGFPCMVSLWRRLHPASPGSRFSSSETAIDIRSK